MVEQSPCIGSHPKVLRLVWQHKSKPSPLVILSPKSRIPDLSDAVAKGEESIVAQGQKCGTGVYKILGKS